MMNKHIERLVTSIQALKQIFDTLELNVEAEIEYKDGSKEEINVYEIIEKQIIKDINSYDSQLAVEEIDYLIRRQSFTREHATITEAINRSESIINKLEKQKEMLEK